LSDLTFRQLADRVTRAEAKLKEERYRADGLNIELAQEQEVTEALGVEVVELREENRDLRRRVKDLEGKVETWETITGQTFEEKPGWLKNYEVESSWGSSWVNPAHDPFPKDGGAMSELDPDWLDRVPPDVEAAATLVAGWFARETWGEWEMGGLASRQKVFRLEEELATMERERDEARRSAESYRARWPHYEWFPWEEGGS